MERGERPSILQTVFTPGRYGDGWRPAGERRSEPRVAQKPASKAPSPFSAGNPPPSQSSGGSSAGGAPPAGEKRPPLPGPLLDAPPTSPATPVIPPPAQEYPIDLPAALALAGVENPTIALARAAVQLSLGLQQQARALLLPSLHAGGNYHYHAGVLQASFGGMREVDSQSLYLGAGARTVAAESVSIPGVQLYAVLADAFYAPLAARQVVTARRFEATATRNNTLLEVTERYFDLVAAQGRLEAIRRSEIDVGKVAELTAAQARTGVGRPADAHRADSERMLFHRDEQMAEEEVAVAAARLSQLLNMDPAVRLETVGPIQLIELIDLRPGMEGLVQTALRNRPEMGARAAAVAASATRLRQERARPFLPTLSIGYSAGTFGGGSNLVASRFDSFANRTDFDALAVWTLQNLGFGNLALARRRRAEVAEAQSEQVITVNRIRSEVADAFSLIQARRRDVDFARAQMETAKSAYDRDYRRIRGLVKERLPGGRVRKARPIELLLSTRLLARARQEYILAVARYNRAQFQMFVALGSPPDLALPGGPGAACAPAALPPAPMPPALPPTLPAPPADAPGAKRS